MEKWGMRKLEYGKWGNEGHTEKRVSDKVLRQDFRLLQFISKNYLITYINDLYLYMS